MAETRDAAPSDVTAWWRAVVDPAGLLLGAVFFAAALTPSLIPRDPLL